MNNVVNNKAFGEHLFSPQQTIHDLSRLPYKQSISTFQVLIALHRAEEKSGSLHRASLKQIQKELKSIRGPSLSLRQIRKRLRHLQKHFLGKCVADSDFRPTQNGIEVIKVLNSGKNENNKILLRVIIPPKCPMEKFSNDSMYYIGRPVHSTV